VGQSSEVMELVAMDFKVPYFVSFKNCWRSSSYSNWHSATFR
jgi:hypothetical protein